jgi:CubicO group peptidase (beta-lactamase class C family)
MSLDGRPSRALTHFLLHVATILVLALTPEVSSSATAPQIGVDNWYWGPGNRWSYKHTRRIFPSANVRRGNGPVSELEYAVQDIDGIVFPHPTTKAMMRVAQMYDATDTDAFLVMKEGKVVTERYFNGMLPEDTHILMSVSKSIVGALAGIVVDHGRLDTNAPVTHYIPELKGSGYEGATVRQLLDMTVGIDFDEDYKSRSSDLYRLDEAAGWVSRGATSPNGLHEYLPTLVKRAGSHGTTFRYISANADAMGWVLERAVDADFAELLSSELWSKLGAEHDAYVLLDGFQNAYTDPGINTTLRDLGRFAQMILQNGIYNGQRIVPEEWIQDMRHNGDRQAWNRSPSFPEFRKLTCFGGGSYRSYWYVADPRCGYFAAIGLAGQLIMIDPTSSAVVVKFSSQSTPSTDKENLAIAGSIAVIDALAGRPRRSSGGRAAGFDNRSEYAQVLALAHP